VSQAIDVAKSCGDCPLGSNKIESREAQAVCSAGGSVNVILQQGDFNFVCSGSGSCLLVCEIAISCDNGTLTLSRTTDSSGTVQEEVVCDQSQWNALCAGVQCSGKGYCKVEDDEPNCVCNDDYFAMGLECLRLWDKEPGEPCVSDLECRECLNSNGTYAATSFCDPATGTCNCLCYGNGTCTEIFDQAYCDKNCTSPGCCRPCTCTNKDCGKDECGNSCGSCDEFESCQNNRCKDIECPWTDDEWHMVFQPGYSSGFSIPVVGGTRWDNVFLASGHAFFQCEMEQQESGDWEFVCLRHTLSLVDAPLDCWGTEEAGMYFSGTVGSMVHRDSMGNESWLTPGTEMNIWGIDGSGPDNVIAVASCHVENQGVILRFDGTDWDREYVKDWGDDYVTENRYRFMDVAAVDKDTAWVASISAIFKYENQNLTKQFETDYEQFGQEGFEQIKYFGPNSIVALAPFGPLVHYIDGWQVIQPDELVDGLTDCYWTCIGGSSPENILVGGKCGTKPVVARFNGARWSHWTLPGSDAPASIWCSSDENCYLAKDSSNSVELYRWCW